MTIALNRWIKISLLNLLIVALLGILMRYKIAFSFPFLHQKFILHAHSHFAFAGWVTQMLMALMVMYLERSGKGTFRQYNVLLIVNLVSAYGMLFSFIIQGYGVVSISFSTLNILTTYWFGIKYWRSLNTTPNDKTVSPWFKAAFIFNIISSLGAFGLAYMMATKNLHQNMHLAAVYFFLHFQYNGWFFFSCMGLLADKMKRSGMDMSHMKKVFILFACACIPAYFLSALWLPIPTFIYVVVVLAALAQVVGGFIFFRQLYQQRSILKIQSNTFGNWLMGLSAAALAIKLLLQGGSTVPSLSDLAFGFRPIVIGYLHLVLLAVITLFIVGYIVSGRFMVLTQANRWGLCIFAGGIGLNEMLLMVQGVAAMNYEPVPYIDVLLLAAGIIMFSGILLLNLSGGRKTIAVQHDE